MSRQLLVRQEEEIKSLIITLSFINSSYESPENCTKEVQESKTQNLKAKQMRKSVKIFESAEDIHGADLDRLVPGVLGGGHRDWRAPRASFSRGSHRPRRTRVVLRLRVLPSSFGRRHADLQVR